MRKQQASKNTQADTYSAACWYAETAEADTEDIPGEWEAEKW